MEATWVEVLERALGSVEVASTSAQAPTPQTQHHPRHTLLLAQGERSPALYLVFTGAVAVHWRSPHTGRSVQVVRFGVVPLCACVGSLQGELRWGNAPRRAGHGLY